MRKLAAWSVVVVFALVVTVLTATRGFSEDKKDAPPGAAGAQQPPMDPAMMQAMEKAMKPGPEHELLNKFAGKWKCDVKFKMMPDMPENNSSGYSNNEMIFGGRFLKQEYGGDFMGQAFHGMGLMGFDTMKQKYCGTWADEMSTSILYCEGTADADGKVITFTGNFPDPMSGKIKPYKQTLRMTDADNWVGEWFDTAPDGKEFKSMTIAYSRQK